MSPSMPVGPYFERPVLVTGAAGFLGRPLVAALCAAGAEVIAVARSPRPDALAASTTLRWVECDILSSGFHARLVAEAGVVVHLAASKEIAVGGDEASLVRANEEATVRLARAVAATATRVVFASSQMVYGNPGSRSVSEESPLDGMSASAYACSKLNAENWLQHFARASGVPCIALRLCGFVEGGGNIDYMVSRALRNEPIELFERGRICRDYLSLDSGVAALVAATQVPLDSGFVACNVGSGQAMSALAMAEAIRDAVRSTSEIVLVDRPAPRADFVFDISRARQHLGFEPGDLAASVTAYAGAVAASFRRDS